MPTSEERLTEFDKTLSSIAKDVEQVKSEVMSLRKSRHDSNERIQGEILGLELVKTAINGMAKDLERQDAKLTKMIEALIGDGSRSGLVSQVEKVQSHLTLQDIRINAIECLFNGSGSEPGLLKRFDRQETQTSRAQKIFGLILAALIPLIVGLIWAKLSGR